MAAIMENEAAEQVASAINADIDVLLKLDSACSELAVNSATLVSQFTQVVANTKRQVNSIDQLSELGKELDGSISSSEIEAKACVTSVSESYSMSEQGAGYVRDASNAVTDVAAAIECVAGEFTQVVSASMEINGIVRVIQDIASQTNMLALNAAIEAARAGEFGKGFAVVADEVRELAKRTRAATTNISVMVDRIVKTTQSVNGAMSAAQTHTNQSVTLSNQAALALEAITQRMGEAKGAVEKMMDEADTQHAISARIAEHLGELDTLAHTGVDALGKCNTTQREVISQVTGLKRTADSLVPDKEPLAAILDDIETIRINNILIMNSSTVAEAEPCYERIEEADRMINQHWSRFAAAPGRAADRVGMLEQALKQYRADRNSALAHGKRGDFAQVREEIMSKVRVTYAKLKDELIAAQKA